MKNLPLILSIFILSFSSAFAQNDSEAELLKPFHSINSEEMMSWMEKLCSVEFNGRLTGTPEFMASAEWMASKFSEWGLKPAGDNGTFFQNFDMPYTVLNDPGSLSLIIPQNDGTVIRKNYTYPDKYFPGMNSGNGEITSEVVFVGYGVT